jgi:hypothetical protein
MGQCAELAVVVTELAMQRRRAFSTTSSALLRRSASTNLTTSPAAAETKFRIRDDKLQSAMRNPEPKTESS